MKLFAWADRVSSADPDALSNAIDDLGDTWNNCIDVVV